MRASEVDEMADLDYDFHGDFDDGPPPLRPLTPPAPEHAIQDEPGPWRCLRCHGHEFEQLENGWKCSSCGSADYHNVRYPTKTVTPTGTWMFVPHTAGSSPSSAPSRASRRPRRKKNKQRTSDSPPDGGDDFDLEESYERAESEALTHDPVVEPSPAPSRTGKAPHAGPPGPSKPGQGPKKPTGPGLPPDLREPVHAPVTGKAGPRLPRPAVLPRQVDSALSDLHGTNMSFTGGQKKKDDDSDKTGASWNSRKGPEPGIKWKTGQYPPVPLWKYDASDLRAFAKYKKKIEIWQLQMRPFASGKDQALLLYNSLSGEPEQELEHLSVDELYVENGVAKILELLQRQFEQRQIYQKRRFLQDFENMRRFHGESMRAYVLRFRRVMRSLRAVGIEITATFDEEALGSRLLDRSGLSHSDQRMVLIGTQQSLAFETIAETLALQWPEFRPPPPIFTKEGKGTGKHGKTASSSTSSITSSTTSTAPSSRSSGGGKGYPPRRVFVAETLEEEPEGEDLEAADGDLTPPEADEEQDEQQEGNEPEHAEDDDQGNLELQDLANVLTVTARKLSGVTLGRKFTTGGKKVKKTPEELRKVTHCSACGALGHWAADSECPMNKGGKGSKGTAKGSSSSYRSSTFQPAKKGDKPHHVSVVQHHEHGSLQITDEPESTYGMSFTTYMVSVPFTIHEIKNNATGESLAGFMVLDSACQRTCCGEIWFEHHKKFLEHHFMACHTIPTKDMYQFGKGSPTVATTRVYMPTVFDCNPCLLGAGLLPEDIPLLGSNSLMDKLGTIIDLPNRSVRFTSLGCTVPLHVRCGHFCIALFDVVHREAVHSWHVWKEFTSQELWHDPDPELLLPPKPMKDHLTIIAPNSEPGHAVDASTMADPLETNGASPEQVQEERVDHDGRGSAHAHHAQSMVGRSSSTNNGRAPSSRQMRPQGHQEVRQHARSLRQVPQVHADMEVERKQRGMGRMGWIGRLLCTVVAIATTALQQGEGHQGSEGHEGKGKAQDEEENYHEANHFFHSGFERQHGDSLLDQFPGGVRPQDGPLDPGAGLRGLPDLRAGFTTGSGTSQLGASRFPVRGGLPAGQGEVGAGRQHHPRPENGEPRGDPGGGFVADRGLGRGGQSRLGTCGRDGRATSHRLDMKPGTAKRLKGDMKRAIQVYTVENSTYQTHHAVHRPPPCVDLWELFAGEARMTELAHQYDLNALQPQDLRRGQDFKDASTRAYIMEKVKKFKPWLIPMGVDCRLWNQFSINLNWSTPERQVQLKELQRQERPLVHFATDVALEQYKNGRYFLIENPLRSTLWQEQALQELLALPGVWSTTLDAGAYGAEVDGQPLCKPMRWIGNAPGMDLALHRRLDDLEKQYCIPIQGTITRKSQVYPDNLCRQILQELRAIVFQHEPTRFGRPLHHVLAISYPTADLDAWNDISNYISGAYERSNKRPFDIPLDTEMGKSIQQLFRIKAIKIQACFAPTCRRIPANVDEYFTRAAFLQYADKTRAVEVEDLDEIQFPRQRFSKAVEIAVFAYGFRLEAPEHREQVQPGEDKPAIVPGLMTDVSFDTKEALDPVIKRSVARLHINLGHPSPQELLRLLASQGSVPSLVIKAVQGLVCSTCRRLKPPQEPRPASMPSMVAGQFGDELQADIFYIRLLTGQSYPILGVIDRATGLHMAGLMPDRNADTAFRVLEEIWLRPFGVPLLLRCDPDHTFRGNFENRLQSMGCMVEHCAPEAHFQIGMVERRNAILRLTIEKLVDQFATVEPEDIPRILIGACHASNNMVYSRGRSAYQAVFGRQPRLPNDVLSDDHVLSSSTQAFEENYNPKLRAELVRSEAQKCLLDLNASQQLRRALLRKTRNTAIPDLQPGQRCAVWRWSKKGVRKRGAWLTARFLSWDPGHAGKQAWVRLGASTTLVTAEQLRTAHGFEDWTPDQSDIKALKNAAESFTQHILEDERGEPPPDGPPEELADAPLEYDAAPPPPTPSMMVPATPGPVTAAPGTPPPVAHQQATDIHVNIDSPTNIHHQRTTVQMQRFGDLPKSLSRSRRHHGPYTKSPPLPSQAASSLKGIRTQPDEVAQQASQAALADTSALAPAAESSAPPLADNATATLGHTSPQGTQFHQQAILAEDPPAIPTTPFSSENEGHNTLHHQQEHDTVVAASAAAEAHGRHSQGPQHSAEPPGIPVELLPDTEQEAAQQEPLPTLPQKRPFDSLHTILHEADGTITTMNPTWGGTPPQGFGRASNRFHKIYLTTQQRQQDVNGTSKPAEEPDTSADSDESTSTPADKPSRNITRQEAKQLDREIPWRQIASMPRPYVEKFLDSIIKEANSWSEWRSVKPLTREEAQRVLRDKILSKRILRSRACYRDKNVGQGELKAKCRIVCLGHLDPDLELLDRSAPTPGRTTEMLMLAMITAGANCELFETQLKWHSWTADAATAFLQGQQPSERPMELYMYPPKDGLINMTPCWSHPLYKVMGNIYGLANAPALWCNEVVARLTRLHYIRHTFDQMLFIKREGQQIVSMILVYVDDFLGVFRSDYNIQEVKDAFAWGSFHDLANKVVTFKGKELHLHQLENKRWKLKITMAKFINGLDSAKLPRGRTSSPPELTPLEHREFRSVSGCLQWASTQCRPEIGAVVSLSNQGKETTCHNLKDLYDAMSYLKSSPHEGLLMQDIPMNQKTVIVTFSDASWCNAARSGSQIGILIGICPPEVRSQPTAFSPLDWRSCRATRVCRSTLAAEASAADEASDRAAYLNMTMSEILFNGPAHRLGSMVDYVQTTDAKSLYDAVVSEAPNLTDKRSLCNARAIQETVDKSHMHWLPSNCQFADGLTKVSETLRSTFRRWLNDPFAILLEHPRNEKLLAAIAGCAKEENTSEKFMQSNP